MIWWRSRQKKPDIENGDDEPAFRLQASNTSVRNAPRSLVLIDRLDLLSLTETRMPRAVGETLRQQETLIEHWIKIGEPDGLLQTAPALPQLVHVLGLLKRGRHKTLRIPGTFAEGIENELDKISGFDEAL